MLRTWWRLLQYWFNFWVIRLLLWRDVQSAVELTTLGNYGAAWKVPLSLLSKKAICYCGGVGEDISFEQALYQAVQPHIFCFDPTPRAVSYIKTLALPKKIAFFPWGLWSKNSQQKFFAPPQESFVSHSIVNLHQTQDYFLASCKTLPWIMKKLGHTKIDLLKIDIEGAEYMVLNHLLTTSIRPQILAVEFDQPTPVLKTYQMIRKLIGNGYTLCDQTDWNFIFVRNPEATYEHPLS
jgi:FkbM family methyltransferase